jgi:hypothetical protein
MGQCGQAGQILQYTARPIPPFSSRNNNGKGSEFEPKKKESLVNMTAQRKLATNWKLGPFSRMLPLCILHFSSMFPCGANCFLLRLLSCRPPFVRGVIEQRGGLSAQWGHGVNVATAGSS